MEILVPTNEYQTPITKELLSQYPDEVVEQFMEFISTVPFIQNLISPNRPNIKDLPRDDKGRAIIDITNPPIYEDADYFRQSALFFLENGVYTHLRPNSNPNSGYRKFWDRERDRIYNGMLRESDGMWIPGFLYWFLNYCPMMINIYKKGQKKAIRKESFGLFFEGIWLRFLYLYQARENGHHAAELAKRGCGKSYSLAAIMSHNLIVGESEESKRRTITVLTAYQKEYLKDDKDGTLSKFVPILSHSVSNTPFPRLFLKQSSNEMTWQMGYKDEYGTFQGSLNQVIGVSAKDDSDKLRGKRGWILYEEFGNFNGLLELYDVTRKSVEEGDYTYACMYLIGTANNKESNFQSAKTLLYAPVSYNIQEIKNVYDKKGQGKDNFAFFFPAYLNRAGCFNKDGISDVVEALLQILNNRYKAKYGADPTSVLRVIAEDPITPAEAIIKVKDAYFNVQALNERAQQLDTNPRLYDDIYVGELYLDSKGEVSFRPTSDQPIRKYPVDNDTRGALEIYTMPQKDKSGKVFNARYIVGCLLPSEKVMTGSGLKSIKDIKSDEKLVSIDGEYVNIIEKQTYNVIDEDIYKITISGIIDSTTFTKEHPIYSCAPIRKYHYSAKAKRENIPYSYREFNFQFRKAEELRIGDYVKIPNIYAKNSNIPYDKWDNTGIRVDRLIENPLDKEDFWWYIGLILGDGWAANNGYNVNVAFNSKETNTINKFINVSNTVFNRHPILCKDKGTCVEYGICSQQLNRFIVNNFGVYAANKNLPEWIKFLPVNLKGALIKGYIDSDGYVSKDTIEFVSISKKLLNDFQDILFSMEIASSNSILRDKGKAFIGKNEISQQKTYHLRVCGSYIKKLINLVGAGGKLDNFDMNKIWDKRQIKECIFENGYILKRISNIEKNTYTGLVYNFHCVTSTFMCNYIPTHNCDPVDNDVAESASLSSCFVFDLFTDTIVAEYTGRNPYANDNFEITRLLCIFYNAKCLYESNKKGIFAYFESKKSTYLLAETPEYLRDKQLIKYKGMGSNAYGVNASAAINNYANSLLKDWFNKLVPIVVKDEQGNENTVEVPILYTLKNRALIEEAIQFNPEINVDRIRAMGMVMLYRQEYIIKYGDNLNEESREKISKDDVSYDPFFTRNYDNRFLSVNLAKLANSD